MDMYVRSEGCDDPGNVVKCGRAYIYVNGVDHSLHRRGHNIVVVDAKTGNAFFFVLLVNMSGLLIKKASHVYVNYTKWIRKNTNFKRKAFKTNKFVERNAMV